ncbi:hypothetical protein DVB69_16020 [Sporosarcina sp. BI001-red]|uniref:hypothetical protein n=1 Tax=Sporosarcina sp. BI001-red TaxID=2282866 RepID=UPI000E25901F|nr:hypothetical protein [Sporosarcina sp. BI001-red]REB05259.1 hypothetical protein DVB69_16020 [Sporosarcina sp. BI001-red]
MEINDLEIEELGNKIEKYRKAVESLKTTKHEENSQVEKRMESLEEQFSELQSQQAKLSEQMEEIKNLMETIPGDKKDLSTTKNDNRLNTPSKRNLQPKDTKAISTFKKLKQLTNATPMLYESPPTSSQVEGIRKGMANKQFLNTPLASVDERTINPPIVENNSNQLERRTKFQSAPIIEEIHEDPNVTPQVHLEKRNKKTENGPNQASSFWKGILKK